MTQAATLLSQGSALSVNVLTLSSRIEPSSHGKGAAGAAELSVALSRLREFSAAVQSAGFSGAASKIDNDVNAIEALLGPSSHDLEDQRRFLICYHLDDASMHVGEALSLIRKQPGESVYDG